MRKTSALLAAVGLAALLGSCTIIAPSGVKSAQSFYYSGFNQVAVDSAATVTVVYSSAYSVAATYDSSAENYLDVYQSGSTLHVGLRPGVAFPANMDLRATVTMPDFAAVSADGASNVSVNNFSPASYSAVASGASTVTLAGVKANSGSFTASGASLIKSTGGSSVNSANAKLSGASTLGIRVNLSVSGTVNGASNLFYGNYSADVSRLSVSYDSYAGY